MTDAERERAHEWLDRKNFRCPDCRGLTMHLIDGWRGQVRRYGWQPAFGYVGRDDNREVYELLCTGPA